VSFAFGFVLMMLRHTARARPSQVMDGTRGAELGEENDTEEEEKEEEEEEEEDDYSVMNISSADSSTVPSMVFEMLVSFSR
jgi:hypothetical protein